MVGLAVGLITGRRELVAAIVGRRDRRSRSSLVVGPSVGIVAGGARRAAGRAGVPAPASGPAEPIVAESSLPLQPSHMADAVAEADADAGIEPPDGPRRQP